MNEEYYTIEHNLLTLFLPKDQSISPGKALDMLLSDPKLILYGLMKDQPEDLWQYKSCPNKSILFKTNDDTWCTCLMALFVLDVFYTEDLYKKYRDFAIISGTEDLESSFLAGSPYLK
jgi:hypothetical protein